MDGFIHIFCNRWVRISRSLIAMVLTLQSELINIAHRCGVVKLKQAAYLVLAG